MSDKIDFSNLAVNYDLEIYFCENFCTKVNEVEIDDQDFEEELAGVNLQEHHIIIFDRDSKKIVLHHP